MWVAFITYLAYFVLVAVGYVKEFIFPVHQKEKNRQVRKGEGDTSRSSSSPYTRRRRTGR